MPGLLLLLICTLLAAGCSEPEPSKPTFMTENQGVPEQTLPPPEGLNPLGTLEVCPARGSALPMSERVLVSHPELFTREASLMISALRRALLETPSIQPPVQFLLTSRGVQTEAQALTEGRRCGAVMVLWESYGSRELVLTVSEPARIPLKFSIHPRLCEFGTYQDQLQILYLTISGLLATLHHDYDKALFDIQQANGIDSHCLQLSKPSP